MKKYPISLALISLLLTNCTAQQVNESNHESSEIKRYYVGLRLQQANNQPIEERIALYYSLKRDSLAYYQFDNLDDLTMYGYSLLYNGKASDAIAFFNVLVNDFPDDANGYDCLGDTYLELGDSTQALNNFRKAFEMDSGSYWTLDKIRRIEDPGNPPESTGFYAVFTQQQYVEDLEQLVETLIADHPNALLFTSREQLYELLEEKKALITDHTTYGQFVWHCSEIVAALNCSHSSIGNFELEWRLLPYTLRFPLEVRWIEEKLVVVENTGNEDRVKRRDEITAINGVPVQQLVDEIYRHISSQGYVETYKRYEFEGWAPGMIAYALDFPEQFELELKGKSRTVILHQAHNWEYYSQPMRQIFPVPALEVRQLDKQTALLRIPSFNFYWWNNLDYFKESIDKAFATIQANKTENLIIDVRSNRGGSQHAAMHLLQYLMDKPFTYYQNMPTSIDGAVIHPFDDHFTGKLFFLTDGVGNSTTGHFMSLVKEHEIGTIIGEELGSNHLCTAGQLNRRLANTGLEVHIATASVRAAVRDFPVEKGVLPDHTVTYTVEGYFKGLDEVLEYTMELIREH